MSKEQLQDKLPLIASGKVRELYALPDEKLLFVASDRISAFDVILTNGIPGKGKILTSLSRFWFKYLSDIVPNHLADNGDVTQFLPESVREDPELVKELQERALVVNKYKILPLEVIVRGYITGSAWNEYQKTGTVHGLPMPAGMQESQKFPEPIYTPSTKAEQGEHDENISPEQAAAIVGADVSAKVAKIAIALYNKAHDYAAERGIIIADTKFEFGVDANGNIVLVDEVLTPDSSRFWQSASYGLGKPQDSLDKQFVRDWLIREGLKGKDGVAIPADVAAETVKKYQDVYSRLVAN